MRKFILKIDGNTNTRKNVEDIMSFITKVAKEEKIAVALKNDLKDNYDLNRTVVIQLANIENVTVLDEYTNFKEGGVESLLIINSLKDLTEKNHVEIINFCSTVMINHNMDRNELMSCISLMTSKYPSLIDKLFVDSSFISMLLPIVIDENLDMYLSDCTLTTKEQMFISNVNDLKSYEEFINHDLIKLKRSDMTCLDKCSNCRSRLCPSSPVDLADVYFTTDMVSTEMCDFFKDLEQIISATAQSLYINQMIQTSVPNHVLIESLSKINTAIESLDKKFELIADYISEGK